MSICTFFIEYDRENLASMVLARHDLEKKIRELNLLEDQLSEKLMEQTMERGCLCHQCGGCDGACQK